jgi:hypothetical protein
VREDVMAHLCPGIIIYQPCIGNIKLNYEVALFLPYKRDCIIGVECMTFNYLRVIEFRNEWYGYLIAVLV